MAFKIAEAFVDVTTKLNQASTGQLGQKIEGDLAGTATRINKRVGEIGMKMTAGITLPFIGVGTAAFNMASDLSETASLVNTVFGKNAAEIQAWSKSAASSFGQSRQEALAAAGVFGNMFTQLGMGTKDASKVSMQMTELASDFASFHNANPTDVIDAMSSAFRGEYDALQRYVPTINAANVEQKALAMTGKASAKELTALEKATAAQALMVEGAGAALGDFKRTSNGAANQQRILAAQFKDTAAQIGTQLLPIMTELLSFVRKLVGWFANLPGPVQKAIVVIAGLAALAGPIMSVVSAFKLVKTAIMGLQPAFSFLMANPIILALIAIAVAAFLIVKNWSTIKAFLGKVAGWFVDAFGSVLDFIKQWGPKLLELIAFVFFPIPMLIYKNWSKITDFVGKVFGAVKDVITTIFGAIASFFTTIFNIYKTIFTTGLNAIRAVVEAVFTAIKTVIETYINAWRTIISTFMSWLSAAWGGIKTAATAAWNAIASAVTYVWNSIQAAITTGINAITGLFRTFSSIVLGIFSTIGSAITNTFNSLWNTVTTVFGNIVNFFTQLPGKIVGALASVGKAVFDFGKKIIEGLAKGIKAAWDKIPGIIKKPVEWVVGGASNLIGKLPGLATGATNFAGGLALVGEKGPELVNLPSGTDVFTADQTAALLNSRNASTVGGIHIGQVVVQANNAEEFMDSMSKLNQRIRARGGN